MVLPDVSPDEMTLSCEENDDKPWENEKRIIKLENPKSTVCTVF